MREYSFAVAVAALSTGVCFAMFHFFELTNLVMVFLLGTMLVASRGSRGPAALSSALGVLCFDFFFVPPRFTLSVADVQYIWTFIVMFAVAMIISHLTIRLRQEAESAREGQLRTERIHALAERLASAHGLDSVLDVAVRTIAETFNSQIAILMPSRENSLAIKASSGEQPKVDDKEEGIAQWVYNQGQSAGRGTASLPDASLTYIPLVGSQGQVGVLRFQPRNLGLLLNRDQLIFLESFAHQIGLALEVDRLQESTKKAEVEAETERTRSALLSSVSHDLRTPLTAIVGSVGTLLQREAIQKDKTASELLENVQSEGERLSRLIQNLLDATRLESGAVQLRKEGLLTFLWVNFDHFSTVKVL